VSFNSDEWVVGYTIPKEVNQYTKRVSVTNTFLREWVEIAVVYAIGHEKRPVLEKLESEHVLTPELPAAILRDMKNVVLVTDDIALAYEHTI
jgi:6-phosphogluconolactonase/glucosamine-6-phosphate isomerase/deaminase